MSYQHQELAAGRWYRMSFSEQMANVGSEVARAINWQEKNRLDYSQRAFERALELLELTLEDNDNISRLREIARVKEALADFFVFGNSYRTSSDGWKKYFAAFNFAARLNR